MKGICSDLNQLKRHNAASAKKHVGTTVFVFVWDREIKKNKKKEWWSIELVNGMVKWNWFWIQTQIPTLLFLTILKLGCKNKSNPNMDCMCIQENFHVCVCVCVCVHILFYTWQRNPTFSQEVLEEPSGVILWVLQMDISSPPCSRRVFRGLQKSPPRI